MGRTLDVMGIDLPLQDACARPSLAHGLANHLDLI
jgi:hypothetical protein